MKIKITDDLFDIAWRIRAIDDAYVIYYDTDKHRYEVWADNIIQLALPFSALDCRAVELVRKTRVERINKLLAEMENHNITLAAKQEKEASDTAGYKAKQLASYLERKGSKTASVPQYEDI